MREQVVVLSPSNERRKATFSLSKKEESLINSCKETRKWPLLESENADKIKGITSSGAKDSNLSADVEPVIAEKTAREDTKNGEDDSFEVLRQEAEEERHDKGLAGTAPLLQWGQRKRSRCNRIDNHNPKPCNSPDDSAVLFRKTVHIQADKAPLISNPSTSKGYLKVQNGAPAQKEHVYNARVSIQAHTHQEEKRKQAKLAKNALPGARQETRALPIAGSKRGCPVSAQKQEYQKKACSMHQLRFSSPDASAHPIVVGEASHCKVELTWPKLVIGLSRKEKEEDFLIFKGTKLPQRPRRRAKAVERILPYCSPGSWLVDMPLSRYDVREKKRAKKKPRGLKAMESFDSDTE